MTPHTPLGAESDAQRHRVIEYFRRSVATRLDDKQRGAIVVVMQRLHAQDLTATCLDLDYTHLCLPAEATSRTTITFPRSGRVVTRAPQDCLEQVPRSRSGYTTKRGASMTYGRGSYTGRSQRLHHLDTPPARTLSQSRVEENPGALELMQTVLGDHSERCPCNGGAHHAFIGSNPRERLRIRRT